MSHLETTFDFEMQKRNTSHFELLEKRKVEWNELLEGAKQAYENLKFLNDKGLNIELKNCVEFSNELYLKGRFPAITFSRNLIDITKRASEETIAVSSLGAGFPLMGEKHTYESFVKKIISLFYTF